MIPKKIHYCWFGKNPKPKLLLKCINSWEKFCPNYDIIEWNEDNFNINDLAFTKEAYANKKYAFVSDVARVKVLVEHGGIYLDTDVEVFKNFDSILHHKCVLGFEEFSYVATSFMACEANHPLMQSFKNLYDNKKFINKDGTHNTVTNVIKLTDILVEQGLKKDNTQQNIDDIAIYPQEYFSPYDYANCISKRTKKTICEHKFDMSWSYKKLGWRKILKKFISNVMSPKIVNFLRLSINK